MKKVYGPKKAEWEEILRRPTQSFEDIEKTVSEIFGEVKAKGDEAVFRYTELFDGIKPEALQVSRKEIEKAEQQVSDDLKQAIQLAKKNIEAFHAAQKTGKVFVETMAGV
ncbi:MAG: histidinol dehydrogenase, partial [Salinimicrobium sp.]